MRMGLIVDGFDWSDLDVVARLRLEPRPSSWCARGDPTWSSWTSGCPRWTESRATRRITSHPTLTRA